MENWNKLFCWQNLTLLLLSFVAIISLQSAMLGHKVLWSQHMAFLPNSFLWHFCLDSSMVSTNGCIQTRHFPPQTSSSFSDSYIYMLPPNFPILVMADDLVVFSMVVFSAGWRPPQKIKTGVTTWSGNASPGCVPPQTWKHLCVKTHAPLYSLQHCWQ